MVKVETSHLGKLIKTHMQDKQKVTLYLPSGLYRQLKVKAAIDIESMSALVEKAVSFYLKHPETVEEVEASYGKTHQVHICPECSAATVIKDGEMVSLRNQPSVIDEEFPSVSDKISIEIQSKDQEELVPC
jgi:Sec7-like guanine-nucleotide exchange factor